jgi:hypothetical protein
MTEFPRSIKEWRDVDVDVFENEIVPQQQPAVLKSMVKHWPAVEEGLKSRRHICNYIKQYDDGTLVNAIVGAPSINGRFFYKDDLQGFNFERKRVTVSTALDNLETMADRSGVPAIAMQAVPVRDVLPVFGQRNVLPLVDPEVGPRMWLGNKSMIATHYDNYSNIACVVAGRRRFTLFPPEQVANLYIGPLLTTPGGSPVSMVDLRQPDLLRYPRFERALGVCQQAELEPGDAIYIPILWWHGVESLDHLNVLINYWWNAWSTEENAPFNSLLSSILSVSELPLNQRMVWREFFDYFVFRLDDDPTAHLPDRIQDALGTLPPEDRRKLKIWLSQQLLA